MGRYFPILVGIYFHLPDFLCFTIQANQWIGVEYNGGWIDDGIYRLVWEYRCWLPGY